MLRGESLSRGRTDLAKRHVLCTPSMPRDASTSTARTNRRQQRCCEGSGRSQPAARHLGVAPRPHASLMMLLVARGAVILLTTALSASAAAPDIMEAPAPTQPSARMRGSALEPEEADRPRRSGPRWAVQCSNVALAERGVQSMMAIRSACRAVPPGLTRARASRPPSPLCVNDAARDDPTRPDSQRTPRCAAAADPATALRPLEASL